MALVEINWNPDRRQLRVFGIGALAILTTVAALLHYLRGLPAAWAAALSAVGLAIFLVSLASPGLAKRIYVTLTVVTLPIGIAVSFVLMAAFYFLILTPVGLFFRLIGRDTLRRKFDRNAATYWIPRRPPETSDRYFHQF
jgi:multisubunit Na+/H+ antiporter MnhB subunit